jgi:NHL repeat
MTGHPVRIVHIVPTVTEQPIRNNRSALYQPRKAKQMSLLHPSRTIAPTSLAPSNRAEPNLAQRNRRRLGTQTVHVNRAVDPGRLLRATLTSMLRIVSGPRFQWKASSAKGAVHGDTPLAPDNPGSRNEGQGSGLRGKASVAANVSTLSGNGLPGYVDGTGGRDGTTQFNGPYGVCVDRAGNVYVADACNHRIRKISASGDTTTLAGNGHAGYVDGTGGASGTTQFNYPYSVAIDGDGNLYAADASNHRIRKISASGDTTTLAGNGTPGFYDGTGGAAGSTQFESPFDVAVDREGCVYVAETYANRIRKISPDGTTTTLAGNGTPGFADGTGGATGTTQFNSPYAVDVSADGIVYVADNLNNRIRAIATDGTTTTLCGNGTSGFTDGTGQAWGTTQFRRPTGICVGANGTIYVADSLNDRIRAILADGTTTTLAGNRNRGHVDGTAGPKGTAQFSFPFRLAAHPNPDSPDTIYVADSDNNTIRKIH